jgi:hypothetical protein
MIHAALSDATLEALVLSINRLISNVVIPAGSPIREVPDSNIKEVDWLRLRFTDGSELALWPKTITPSINGYSVGENVILAAELRAEALTAAVGEKSRTHQKIVESAALTASFKARQIRSVRVCRTVYSLDRSTLCVDGSVQVMLDDGFLEFSTDHPCVLPMALGIRHIAAARDNAF